MTIKTSSASVQRQMLSSLEGFKDRALNVKEAHRAERQAILDDPRTSDFAKKENLDALNKRTREKLDTIRGEQDRFIKSTREKLERQLRGDQPSDATSVLLRRDAADRVRKITDRHEAMDVLNDALANGDDTFAHAIGYRARSTGMVDVAEAYKAAFPETADSAEALAYVEGMASDPALNMSNSITYSAP